MGSGKTTLINAICRQLGVRNRVTSPSFALVNEYHTRSGEVIFHFDFYRIKSIEEAFDLGYEEYFYSDAWCFIEWAEKAVEILPDDFVRVNIEVLPTIPGKSECGFNQGACFKAHLHLSVPTPTDSCALTCISSPYVLS